MKRFIYMLTLVFICFLNTAYGALSGSYDPDSRTLHVTGASRWAGGRYPLHNTPTNRVHYYDESGVEHEDELERGGWYDLPKNCVDMVDYDVDFTFVVSHAPDFNRRIQLNFRTDADNDVLCSGNIDPGTIIPNQPTSTCSIVSALTINHGSLSEKSIKGAIASQSVKINCDGDTSINVSLQGDINYNKEIFLQTNLYSTLKLDGVILTDTGSKLNLLKGDNVLQLSSTLDTTGGSISAGAFSKSVVLMFSPD